MSLESCWNRLRSHVDARTTSWDEVHTKCTPMLMPWLPERHLECRRSSLHVCFLHGLPPETQSTIEDLTNETDPQPHDGSSVDGFAINRAQPLSGRRII